MNALSNGLSIFVESTNKTYHTLDDWDLALGNNNYIGDPVMETIYIDVPYRDTLIDASTAVTGRPVYKARPLAFKLGGLRERMKWDSIISRFRNEIDGRICQITLDNDPHYYWRGRVFIEGFDRVRELGQFTLNIPKAEPYKYYYKNSTEPWEWDPFNFETDTIIYTQQWDINGTVTKTVPAGHMPTVPTFMVTNLVNTLTVTAQGITFNLVSGKNVLPEITVGGDAETELTFSGRGKVQIIYKSGSL
ncbi:MAG: hypothetical protein IJI23_00185 [Lachnospiraceae bacterium]|nr:hypothetical protein [Lachnospiraceae bacterium]